MRIALVSEHASPLALLGGADAGGQNVHVAELARALGRQGHEVVVHTRRDDPAIARSVAFAPGVTVDHVPAGPAEPVPKDELLPHMAAFARDLAATWQADRPDVVHSHFWMSGLAALDAATTVDVPVLHTYHALGLEKRAEQGAADTSPPERLEIERRIAVEADGLVATTAAEATTLVAIGADPSRIAVVPCGVDLTQFRPFGGRSGDGREERRGRHRRRILAASRLVPRKGVADVITSLRWLPDAELVVAGGPPAGLLFADAEGRRLQELAERLGVSDRTTFLGAVRRDAMPGLMRSADVVACCPWYEPFGLVAVEAMACGVPVVATGVGGLAETVLDGVTGIHVRPRDPRSIAHGLRGVLSDERRRLMMGRAAVRRAAGYGWDDIATRTRDVALDRMAGRVERGAV
ncbi:MAG: glycosyl transferase, group 1 [Acidimicrobiales bacterium]|nr:glycosyl transferase, group 1 [Acidimicrobiales bacterium]